MPPACVYERRFGGLLRAYKLIGYTPRTDYRFVEENRLLRAMHPELLAGIVEGLSQAGGRVEVDTATSIARVNGQWTFSLSLSRCCEVDGHNRWRLRFDASLKPDITLASGFEALCSDDEISRAPASGCFI